VSVNLFEDTLVVGTGSEPTVYTNALQYLSGPGDVAKGERLSELALWFAAAPVTNGAYAYGAHPMYGYTEGWFPLRYSTSASGTGLNKRWTVDYIKHFIHISIGASLHGEASKWPKGEKVALRFNVYISELDLDRPSFFLILPCVIILLGAFLRA
jgi:hypothetical protein